MSANDIRYVQQQARQRQIKSLETSISSAQDRIRRKQDELRSAPSYKHNCILQNIASTEKSIESLRAGLNSLRRSC